MAWTQEQWVKVQKEMEFADKADSFVRKFVKKITPDVEGGRVFRVLHKKDELGGHTRSFER